MVAHLGARENLAAHNVRLQRGYLYWVGNTPDVSPLACFGRGRPDDDRDQTDEYASHATSECPRLRGLGDLHDLIQILDELQKLGVTAESVVSRDNFVE
jgi:hypothetical protein